MLWGLGAHFQGTETRQRKRIVKKLSILVLKAEQEGGEKHIAFLSHGITAVGFQKQCSLLSPVRICCFFFPLLGIWWLIIKKVFIYLFLGWRGGRRVICNCFEGHNVFMMSVEISLYISDELRFLMPLFYPTSRNGIKNDHNSQDNTMVFAYYYWGVALFRTLLTMNALYDGLFFITCGLL